MIFVGPILFLAGLALLWLATRMERGDIDSIDSKLAAGIPGLAGSALVAIGLATTFVKLVTL